LTSIIHQSLFRAATRLSFFALLFNLFVTTVPRSAIGKAIVTSQQTQTIERLVHLKALGPGDNRYAYVPFAVPAHTVRIEVSYQYDRAGGANTIDIGLFDARSSGSDKDPRGFRGWSGGRRSEFFVSQNEATPGYLQGAMPAGTWRIILGLYRVAPSGVDVNFKISITTDHGSGASRPRVETSRSAQPKEERPSESNITAGQDLRWWSGDLHMHTIHSDGDWTIDELLASARDKGLDFICITDHNTSSHHLEIDRLRKNWSQPLVLRGEEITTYGGHTNAWGLSSGTWIDFRVVPKDSVSMSKVAAAVHRAGGLISINHPFAPCGGCSWSYDSAVNVFDAIEVWNGEWDLSDDLALTMWDKILQSGRHFAAIGSSDSHRPANPIGQPTTHVAARIKSQTTLLNAIRQGRVYLTSKVAEPVLTYEAEIGAKKTRWMIGDEIHLTTPAMIRFVITTRAVPPGATFSLVSNGQVLRSLSATRDGSPQVIEIECRSDSYYRVEVRDAARVMLALTNPIYVKIRKR
jgi:hypothetical protein